MEKYSIQEVVEQAVQTERLGYDFYTRMSGKFGEDAKLKKLFETLAAKELQHEMKFSELKKTVPDNIVDETGEASAFLRAVAESEFFLGKNKSLVSLEHLNAGADAVRFAIGFERETLLYYYGLKDVLGEDAILNEIINEEKSHIRWLAEMRQSL
ncbi:MAG: hypothetical protein C4538_05415 [Nitrospiraceae bacterium]|nr:MAG: hypothetical protein C4538_05415 [Nitrospiraceae bacterium]